jgi:prepilin-type N-terminal cleavage/methylation domain-containing protein
MILRSRGFTLIELLIAVALFVFLIMLAGPYLGQIMANSQIRTGAEAMYNGVQQAQASAIHGNAVARLLVDTTTGTGGWQVLQTVDGTESPTPVQVYTVQDGAPKVTVTPVPADARQITFDAFGRVVPNVDASSTLTCIKVTHSMTGTRQLNVAISSNALNTGTKLCDPAVVSTEPQACPAGCT